MLSPFRSMPKVYSYSRFSTPEQAAGDSARRQTEAARAWAEKQGLELDERLSIADLGVSAFEGANLSPEAGLGRFVEAVREGLVEGGSVLLLESLDRLSRAKPRAAVRLLEDIVDAGVTVVTLNDGQQYDAERLDKEPTSFLVAFLVAMRAHEESLVKGQRVAAAWAEKRRRVRAGDDKRLTRKGPAWLRPEGDGWAVDEEKAEAIRRVFRMTLEGIGEHRIAELLNREGVPPLGRAKRWHRSSVAKLLRNRAVIGDLVPGRIERRNGRKVRVFEEPIAGAFPAIVDEADWCAVRTLKDGRAPAVRGRGAKRPLANILGGLARCPICGSAMTRVMKGNPKKAGKPKLVCTLAKAGGDCVYRSVPLDEVEEAVLRKGAWLVENIPAGDKAAELDDLAEELEGRIWGLEEHFRDLSEAVADTGTSRAAAERLAKLGAEIETAKAELEAVEERRAAIDGGLVRVRAYALATALRDFDGADLGPINAALRVVFDAVVVDYRKGDLIFRWRQGGETVVPYAFNFGPERGAEAPSLASL